MTQPSKFISALLALAVPLAMLAACGSPAPESPASSSPASQPESSSSSQPQASSSPAETSSWQPPAPWGDEGDSLIRWEMDDQGFYPGCTMTMAMNNPDHTSAELTLDPMDLGSYALEGLLKTTVLSTPTPPPEESFLSLTVTDGEKNTAEYYIYPSGSVYTLQGDRFYQLGDCDDVSYWVFEGVWLYAAFSQLADQLPQIDPPLPELAEPEELIAGDPAQLPAYDPEEVRMVLQLDSYGDLSPAVEILSKENRKAIVNVMAQYDQPAPLPLEPMIGSGGTLIWVAQEGQWQCWRWRGGELVNLSSGQVFSPSAADFAALHDQDIIARELAAQLSAAANQ